MTQTAEYACRAMAHLATLPEGGAIRARDLSRVTHIPLPYLSKVLRKLVLARLLSSQKGHGGGFTLARPAASIRFDEILAAADALPDPDRCAFGYENCNPVRPCSLHPAWADLKRACTTWASRTTLASVSRPSRSPAPRRPRSASTARGSR